ncbi:MAG: ABC transporter ATP-binding protein [Saprospiraceae bacterium]|nr:ABC transporter ATP-binding protein [Saprospiraceae bacterium]MBK7797410.1 ABC transporter ATP-binding protein [Saprospiraceae bacterium]MBL0261477.1 ABC transporter ATP-binding protein [Saprospiraceae bacterium]
MKEFLNYLSKLKNYKSSVVLYLICYLFTAIFTVVSIPAIIPLFEMLFFQATNAVEKPQEINSVMTFIQSLKYQFSVWVNGMPKKDALTIICLLICGIFFLKNLFRYSAIYIVAPIKAGLIRDTRSELFRKFVNLPLAYFSEERKGDLIARMTADVQDVEWTLLSTLESWVKDPLIIIGSIAFMTYISLPLTLFVLVLLFITAFVIGGISRSLKKNAVLAQEEFGELISVQEESLGGIRIIKAFGSESYIIGRFERILKKYRDLVVKIHRRRELAPPLSEFLGIVIVSILLWYGASLVFSSKLEASSFLAFIYAFFNVIEPSKTLSASYFNVQKGMAALQRIQAVLKVEETIRDQDDAQPKETFDYDIEFRNVSFKYPGTQEYVLKNINLKIGKGEKIALVGSSGSGKTTLVDVLSRFHDIQEGDILIDGIALKNIKIESLRKIIGMVTQEAILFNDTIEDNILFGQQRNKADLESAMKLSHSFEFITEEGKGLDFNIGDRGTKLSGGQRQRLTLARAIYKNAEILILDEATSALDSASEKFVQDAMDGMLKDRTAIVIAHRLSTIQKVDRIYVMSDGRIVESGNHAELLDKNGEYRKFVELQTM